ncbi:Ankyrin repeat protein, partial [Giardia duodenalis]
VAQPQSLHTMDFGNDLTDMNLNSMFDSSSFVSSAFTKPGSSESAVSLLSMSPRLNTQLHLEETQITRSTRTGSRPTTSTLLRPGLFDSIVQDSYYYETTGSEGTETSSVTQDSINEPSNATVPAHALSFGTPQFTLRQKDLMKVRERGDIRLIQAAHNGDIATVSSLMHLVQLKNHRGMTALMAAASADHDQCVSTLLPYENGLQANNGVTALMCAAAKGSVKSVSLLIDTELRIQDKNGRSALMYAAQKGNYECVKLLLGEAMLIDKSGNTALIMATMMGHMHCVRCLIKHEAGFRLPSGLTALMISAYRKDAAITSLLLSECKMRDTGGKTALMYGAEVGADECVEILMIHESGIRDSKGNTALMYGARAGHFGCVELLAALESRCINSAGHTALMMAACGNFPDCIDALVDLEGGIKDKTGKTALMIAVSSGAVASAKLLLSESRAVDKEGNFALMYAVHKSNETLVRLLSEKEARMQTPKGYTALMVAASMPCKEIAEYLLDEIGLATKDGYCALYYAIDAGNSCAINLLLPYEASLLGITPDMRYALCGDVVSLALSHTRNVLQKDKFGRTALVYAILGNHLKCVELLVENKDVADVSGWTPLMYAAKRGHIQYIDVLRGSNLSAKNKNGHTLLDIARKAGHTAFFRTAAHVLS